MVSFFIAQVENLEVEPDSAAKVVIDEVAGVIVMGDASASPPWPSPRAT
jgi:flagellar basal body P-ring protein FlgI